MNDVSADRLKEIEARAHAATEGPWDWRDFVDHWGALQKRRLVSETVFYEEYRGVHKSVVSLEPRWKGSDDSFFHGAQTDLDFIANARTDIPYLLALVQGMREHETRITEALRRIAENDLPPRIRSDELPVYVDGQKGTAVYVETPSVRAYARAVLASGPDTDSSTS